MEIALIILIILIFVLIIWNTETNNKTARELSVYLIMILSVIFGVKYNTYTNKKYPTAIDVYQGKTTLEITYRDSIPVDTVVVYKPEFKK